MIAGKNVFLLELDGSSFPEKMRLSRDSRNFHLLEEVTVVKKFCSSRPWLVTCGLALVSFTCVMGQNRAMSSDAQSEIYEKIEEIQKELSEVKARLVQEIDQVSEERLNEKVADLREKLAELAEELKQASAKKAEKARKNVGEWLKKTGEKISDGD